MNKPILWLCLETSCGKQWKTAPGNIIYNEHGCPHCAKRAKITNDEADKRLNGRNIKRLDDCNGAHKRMHWLCTKEGCGHIWIAPLYAVITNGKGCMKCSGKMKRTNEYIDEKLQGRCIERIDNYKNMDTKIHWRCTKNNCNNIWLATPDNVINKNKSGCPKCKYSKNQRLVGEILNKMNINIQNEVYLKDIISVDSQYHIDFYLSDYNTIIEYNGEQHYKPVDFSGHNMEQAIKTFVEYQQPRDAFIKKFCADYNINLIVIDGRRYKNSKLEKYINDVILPQLTIQGKQNE